MWKSPKINGFGLDKIGREGLDRFLADEATFCLHGVGRATGSGQAQEIRQGKVTGKPCCRTRDERITRADGVAALDVRYRDAEQALAAAGDRTGRTERDDGKGDAIIQKCLHLTDNIGLVFDGTAA